MFEMKPNNYVTNSESTMNDNCVFNYIYLWDHINKVVIPPSEIDSHYERLCHIEMMAVDTQYTAPKQRYGYVRAISLFDRLDTKYVWGYLNSIEDLPQEFRLSLMLLGVTV